MHLLQLAILAYTAVVVRAGPLYPNATLSTVHRTNTSIAIPVVPQPVISPAKPSKFTFGVLGDSWASRVAFNKRTEYDGNAGNCFRSTDTYGVQMAADDSWAGSNPNFNFTACSGSHVSDVAGGVDSQLSKVSDPDLLILTTGGNDAGFFDVVDSCVYVSTDRDYGLPYYKDPDRTGACAKAIDRATDTVTNSTKFGSSLRKMYTQILTSDKAKANPNLHIYQTGYVHFFNVDDGNTWCDKWSFHPNSDAKLTLALRKEINELVERANVVIQQVISSFNNEHLGYVSITEGYNGHRFCEPDSNYVAQFTSSNVWNWNIQPSGVAGWDYNKGDNFDPQNPLQFPEPVFQFDEPSTDVGGKGVWMRPFHPKKQGYSSLKSSILAKLKADKFPS